MHLAFVTPIYPPDNGWGGIGTYVFHLAHALTLLGHRVTVLCGYREQPAVAEEGSLRVVRQIHTEGVNAQQRSEQIANLLETEVLGSGIDAVEFGEYGGDGALFQRRHPGFPVVVKLHCPTRLCSMGEGPRWQEWVRRRWLAPSARLADELEQESARRAKVVVAPSRWLMQTVLNLGWSLPEKRAVVPNPFGGWPGQEVTWQTESGQGPRVLVLGRLSRIKGADLLPAIFERVWREQPATRFELVGQDTPRNRRETWQQYLVRRTAPARRSRLSFRGGVPYPDLPSVLRQHEVALFASRFESSSYTLVECLWAGLACVVGSGGGAQEVGEDTLSALHTARDPGALAKNVLRLLNDAELRQRLQSAARLRARTAFDPMDVAREMTGIYLQAGAREVPKFPSPSTRAGRVQTPGPDATATRK